MKYLKSLAALMLCLFVFAACNGQSNMNNKNGNGMTKQSANDMISQDTTGMMSNETQFVNKTNETIGQFIMGNDAFNQLANALKSAGLVSMLDSGGPYTVLVPTNEAFDELDDQVLNNLMNNKQKLKSVLQNHVFKKKITPSDIQGETMIASAEGTKLQFEVDDDGEIKVNGLDLENQIKTANGIIYVIDEILMPKTTENM